MKESIGFFHFHHPLHELGWWATSLPGWSDVHSPPGLLAWGPRLAARFPMATQAQVNDILTCGAVAGFSGYKLKRLESWVRFYCHPEHPDRMTFSEPARLQMQKICAENRAYRNAFERCDAERAKDLALSRILDASRSSFAREFEKTVRYNAKHQASIRRKSSKRKPDLKILPRSFPTSTERDSQQG